MGEARADAERVVAEALAEHVASERLAETLAATAVAALDEHPQIVLRLAHPERYR